MNAGAVPRDLPCISFSAVDWHGLLVWFPKPCRASINSPPPPPPPLPPAYMNLFRRCRQLQVCPGDCSGAGTCHHSNGTCSCFDHRVGDDCSSPYCPSVFSARCAECTFEACTSCESGYFVDEAGGGYECLSCALYDPRCTK